MKKLLAVFVVCLISMQAFAQNPKFDKLEMLFDQGHYKRVHRKANRLIDNPEYDFSYLPKYYKSLSLLQLSQNEQWLSRHKGALVEAENLFLEVKKSDDGDKIFDAHMFELSSLKNDLVSWAADLKRRGLDSEFRSTQELIDVLFESIDIVEGNAEVIVPVVDSSYAVIPENLEFRDEIIVTAKQQIGIPYVWAGSSPEGFDCSGFTSYVMKQNGTSITRRAEDQFNASEKVKPKNVDRGDLVFFNNGSGISHVGIVVSEKGAPLKMIHSSSSKGVIITDVSKSEYWSKRLHGFGTYVK